MEAETLGETLNDVQALFETPPESLAEEERWTLYDTLSDAQALVETLAYSQAEVEAETPGETRGDAKTLVDTLADLRKHWSTGWLTHKQRFRQKR